MLIHAPATPVRAYCQRLQLIALALIVGQIMYLIIGWVMQRGILTDVAQKDGIVQIGFVAGILLIAASFFVVRRPAGSLAEHGTRFFVGFALAEAGTLIGLALCLLFGAFTPLLVLVVATGASIFTHYSFITRRIRESRELNPHG